MEDEQILTPEQAEQLAQQYQQEKDDRREIRNMIEYYGIDNLRKMIDEVEQFMKDEESERYQSKY
jgi:hypothetical protein